VAAALVTGCADDSNAVGDAGAAGADAGARDAGVDAGGLDAGGRDASSALPDAGPADGGADAGPDAGPGLARDVRFVVMGDVGEGNEDQHAVAAQVDALCEAEGCDFVMLLGDNFYDSGVSSVDDPQWITKFEEPYADIDLPFYAVLGNHDYGGVIGVCPACSEQGGLGNEWDRGPFEVMYTDRSSKWTMLDTHYTFQVGHVGFVMLDTNSILWDDTTHGDQRAWYDEAVRRLRASGAEWIIGAGHHPYLSNGRHGNAGSYESIEVGGTDIPIPLPILDGRSVVDFFDEYVCGDADVYFAGHDHNRQWLNEPTACGGTELIVSGAGAKTTEWGREDRNASHWQDNTLEGFMYVRIDGDAFYGRFVNKLGVVEYERMVSR